MALSAAGRYTQLQGQRDPFLRRARESAKLTIPALMPEEGSNGSTQFITPFQGLGADGVNTLSAKLLLALLPPNSPFFRLQIDDFTLERLTQREGMRGEVEKALNKIERAVMTEIETTSLRVQSGEALKQLIVAGNALLFMMPERGMRVFHLDRYVVHRDPAGNVLEIITKESVAPSALPEDVREALPKPAVSGNDSVEKTVDLYTYVRRGNGRWNIFQEINGVVVPGSRGWYPLDKSPWIPLRWTHVDGESYGRGFIEEHIGDLRSLENLTKAIVEGSAAAAKVLFLVDPNGTTQLRTLTEARSGAVRAGNAKDVSVLQLDKYADFQIAFKTLELITQRLSKAFMLMSVVQRPGERVTAEEIRRVAGELDDAFGGTYSILSQEFQLPLVSNIMFRMEKAKRMPTLPKDLVRPAITTGIEALGRGQDLNKLDQLMMGLAQLFGPEAVAQEMNVAEYISRRGTALGIDMGGLVKSPEQKAQEAQQAQMQAMMEKLGPKGMDIVRDQMDPSKQAPDAP
jgi:hypothetical protein